MSIDNWHMRPHSPTVTPSAADVLPYKFSAHRDEGENFAQAAGENTFTLIDEIQEIHSDFFSPSTGLITGRQVSRSNEIFLKDDAEVGMDSGQVTFLCQGNTEIIYWFLAQESYTENAVAGGTPFITSGGCYGFRITNINLSVTGAPGPVVGVPLFEVLSAPRYTGEPGFVDSIVLNSKSGDFGAQYSFAVRVEWASDVPLGNTPGDLVRPNLQILLSGGATEADILPILCHEIDYAELALDPGKRGNYQANINAVTTASSVDTDVYLIHSKGEFIRGDCRGLSGVRIETIG